MQKVAVLLLITLGLNSALACEHHKKAEEVTDSSVKQEAKENHQNKKDQK